MSGDFDMSSFLRGIQRASVTAQQAAVRGVAKVLARTEQLAKEACPVDQSDRKPGGTLQGSIVAHVADIAITSHGIVGYISAGAEAADYAVVQHERELVHSKPVSGRYASKYIENPLKQMSEKTSQVVGEEVRQSLNN